MLSHVLDISRTAYKTTKELRAEKKPDDCDLLVSVDYHRGDRLMAVLFTAAEEEGMLAQVMLGVLGFDADEICVAMDTMVHVLSDDPEILEALEQGRMAFSTDPEVVEARKQENAALLGPKGSIRESLCFMAANRAGDIQCLDLFYHFDAGCLIWDEEVEFVPEGGISQELKRIMALDSLDAWTEQMNIPLVEIATKFEAQGVDTRTIRDVSTTKVLINTGAQVALCTTDPDTLERVARALGGQVEIMESDDGKT